MKRPACSRPFYVIRQNPGLTGILPNVSDASCLLTDICDPGVNAWSPFAI